MTARAATVVDLRPDWPGPEATYAMRVPTGAVDAAIFFLGEIKDLVQRGHRVQLIFESEDEAQYFRFAFDGGQRS